MKTCPYCGKDNDDSVKVCIRCYAGFPEKQKDEKPSDEQETTRSARKRIRS